MVSKNIPFTLFVLFFSWFSLHAQTDKNSIDRSELIKQKNGAEYYNQIFSSKDIDTSKTTLDFARMEYEAARLGHDSIREANALVALGSAYSAQYHYTLAMESFLKAKKITDRINSPSLTASVYHAIGGLYLDMRNIQLAREYLSRALEIRRQLDDKEDLSTTINRFALVLWLQGELDSALTYLFRTLEIETSVGNNDGISRACNNIGIVYHEKREYRKSIEFLLKALEISRERNNSWTAAETCNNIGEVYISMGNYSLAETYLSEARKNAEEIKASLLLADNYRYMARLYKRTGRYEKALDYYERFHDLDDSLFSKNSYTIISELTSLFEIEKREQSLVLQNQKIEILEAKRKIDNLLKVILSGVILFILVIAAIIYNRHKRIEARNKLLLEKDKQIQETQAILMASEKAEKERLACELESNNKFLIDFALYIGMKNEFLSSLREEIKKSAKKTGNTQDFKHILYQINQNLRFNKELIDLQKNVDRVNIEFIHKLLTRFPGLTENEKQLAILLRLNFSTKEIADLRAVSVKAIEMSRYRLRKRIGLDDSENLTHFIQNI